MSTMSDPDVVGVPFLTARQRRDVVTLPENPTNEELARDWLLSEADTSQVLMCRGDDNRRRFALQLCVLRKYGRFLQDYTRIPVSIIGHLNRQLALDPVLVIADPERETTTREYAHRIREHLGWHSFDQSTRDRLGTELHEYALDGHVPKDSYHEAEDLLRKWKTVLPAPSTTERIVAKATARAQREQFARISGNLQPDMRAALDELLTVPEGSRTSLFALLRAYPRQSSATDISEYIKRIGTLQALLPAQTALKDLRQSLVHYLAEMARRYDVHALKQYVPEKRHALLACFLVESYKSALDFVVEMHDQVLIKICRVADYAYEKQHRALRRRARKGRQTLEELLRFVFDPERPRETTVGELYQRYGEQNIREAYEAFSEYQRLDSRGYPDELVGKFNTLRRYFPEFLKLPFELEAGNKTVLESMAVARKLHAGELRKLPDDVPVDFVPAPLRKALRNEDGTLNGRLWEMSLALKIRDLLRSGDLCLPRSRHHTSFWNLVYDPDRWKQERPQAYVTLNLPTSVDDILERLRKDFDTVARTTEAGIDRNPFAEIVDGKLKYKRPDALEVPTRVKEIRNAIQTQLPSVRIEYLLAEVDAWCRFREVFLPLGGYEPRSDDEDLSKALLATLIAHGTNLGISAMGASAEGISTRMLQRISTWFLRDETLNAANATLVNYHHKLALSSVWGQGNVSSSDGQRFAIQGKSLLGAPYPRYFGYYDRAVSLYTHVSDQYSVFSTRVISCAPREALYVLEGLLENNTALKPKVHFTDEHGYTEQLFALCFLLGYSFMPRIKDLKNQRLYKIDRRTNCTKLDNVFDSAVNTALIRDHWDSLVRVAASLRNRTAPAHVIAQRLVQASPSNRLAKALSALGRIIKTIYILRYIQEEDLRHNVQLQLNRGEHRHSLAQALFFANQGEFRKADSAEIMNKASCLSILSNATLVWNTVRLEQAVERLRQNGENILDEHLSRISPLMKV